MTQPNSDFSAIKTKFHNNRAVSNGGAIYRRQSGHMALDQCSFRNNCVNDSYRIYGSDIAAIVVQDLRLSQCNFVHKATDPTAAISITVWIDILTTLFSFKTNINYGSKTLLSTDPLFLKKADAQGWIYRNSKTDVMQIETQFASCKYFDHACSS